MIDELPNIRHMAALAATVRHGSLTRAARAVNLTQSALTQAIMRLERDLGCALFDRSSSGMTPTEAALLLAPRAEAAISRIGSPRVTGTQLRAFLSVARAGSFAGAAEATGLSTASLHRAVADLSLALGQRLIERRGRQLILTIAGRRRQRDFGVALAELRSGFDEVATWQGKTAGRIVVGAMPLCRAGWLPSVLLRFVEQYPGIDVSIVEGSFAEMVGSLRDGEIDLLLGALRDSAGLEDLEQQWMFDDLPKLVMRDGHPLCDVEKPRGADIIAYPWILPQVETPLRRYWAAMLRTAGEEPPHVAIECGSMLTTRQFLLQSDAISLLSPAQLAVEVDAGLLVTIEPPVPIVRAIGVTTRNGWRPTEAQTHFLALLATQADDYKS